MPRFYFHVRNAKFARDEEGLDLPDANAAREQAVKGLRSIVCEEVQNGVFPTDLSVDVHDEADRPVLHVEVADAVRVEA